ncbi:MAG TPA: DUF4350 domain-containing protein [Planctomycetota bacterium]
MFVASLLTLAASAQDPPAQAPPRLVHAVCDISQSFTFYMDGRFHRQYLEGHGRDARNWGSLAKLELGNVNLLVLTGGDVHVPYAADAIANVQDFVRAGGALLLMADGGDPEPPGAAVAGAFDARLEDVPARAPLRGLGEFAKAAIEFRGGKTLRLTKDWTPLLVDARDRPVLARRDFGKGQVLLGSRGLFGQNPDASDPINAAWVTPLLVGAAARKAVEAALPHDSTWAELTRQVGPLTLEFHAGTAPYADAIASEYQAAYPHLVAVTGVEPAPGMIKKLLVLPTGGGGFSSGERIAIGAWWGGYPGNRYPMVELIGHEAGHSWVLPYAEPLWNEPIATWLGIQVGRRMQLKDADATLARQIAAGRRHDPDFTAHDPLAKDAPRDLVWGKAFFVFEELEKAHGPGAMAKYFRTKRRVLAPGRAGYSMDDCVAVWSLAVGEDLFPWFRSLSFDVDRARTDLPEPR